MESLYLGAGSNNVAVGFRSLYAVEGNSGIFNTAIGALVDIMHLLIHRAMCILGITQAHLPQQQKLVNYIYIILVELH
jgi:hypothetical protein